MSSFGTKPLDKYATGPKPGQLVYIQDNPDSQGEALLHEILSTQSNVVYNDPLKKQETIKSIFNRSRYASTDGIDIRTESAEENIPLDPYDVAIFDNFHYQEINNSAEEIGTRFEIIMAELKRAETTCIIRSTRDSPTAASRVITDIADVIAHISTQDDSNASNYTFYISKNRGRTPMEDTKPIEFKDQIEIDPSRDIS